jgi:putative nucleotidyltransferase with HDIG domain
VQANSGRSRRAVAASLIGAVGACLSAAYALRADQHELLTGLGLALALVAVLANLASATWEGPIVVSGSFVALMLAIAYLGPAPAFSIAALSEVSFWVVDRYSIRALGVNILGSGAPVLIAGLVFEALSGGQGWTFYALLAAVSALELALNYTVVTGLSAWLHGYLARDRLRAHLALAPALGINVALTVASAAIYRQLGMGAVVFVLISILAFTYMARLVVTARERTRQYAGLSWGVLSGLIRTLDLRDSRASRHAAAVAAFSRDIAQTVGMSERECELAHTAGLLHDIGRFGLSDRVMERGRTLTEQDWHTIRQHPEMGADLLRDLGMYGPVAEIVRAHHERVDGRGYPDGLVAEQIPEIAKIVAVAEVYDTLTADDTYRTPVSSFEALTELRRVAGTQLDARYVEALAELLAGQGVDYRHADRADFDEELDVERRIGEAVGAAGAAVDQAAGQ